MKTKTIVFIDASNIIYGTRDEGWKVDFKKLYRYLIERYEAKKVYYFAGKDENNPKQTQFYKILKSIGYELILKPVKLFKQEDGTTVRKANCDVDLTFFAMRDFNDYMRGIFMTGDGDFEILFRFLINKKKKVVIIANSKRTAREIKLIRECQFNDLSVIRHTIEY